MHVHFIGIGGIGVSALAKLYLAKRATVSGSDLTHSEITDELEALGVRIAYGAHKKSNIPEDTSLLIYTAAVKKDNPELTAAREHRIPVQSYPEAVGAITKDHRTITISGTHGKSTTTALAALVLEEGYCDPTVIVGTKIREFGNSNFRKGKSGYFVLEADEWNKSFLKYHPLIAVVTNIDADHLDTYKTLARVEEAFAKYLARVPEEGTIVANADDPTLTKIAKRFGKRVRWYSLKDRDAADIRTALRVPGEHNVSNALAAARVGQILGIQWPHILAAIARFGGTWRRFEFKGVLKNAFFFTDYGHHPTEIKATIQAARERFPMRRIWCVYQPHQYQRLSYLWNDFITAFDMADRVVLLPVYDVAGRETKTAKEKVNSEKLAHELLRRGKDVSHADSFEAARDLLFEELHPSDVVLIMGAGDIYEFNAFLGLA